MPCHHTCRAIAVAHRLRDVPLHRAAAEACHHGEGGRAICESFPARDGHERRFEGGRERPVLAVGCRLPMYGVSSNDRADIPDGMVLSLTRTKTNGTPGTFNAKVGAGHFKKTDTEVYSR